MKCQGIREADNEQDIYSLLHAYIDVIRLERTDGWLPAVVTFAPIAGPQDVSLRIAALMAALDRASRHLADDQCVAIKEALYVFGAAATRLAQLAARARAVDASADDAHFEIALAR